MAEITLELLEKRLEKGGADKLVLFVCTGNTCRSPMAAAVFNHIARIPPICSMCDMERYINAKRVRALSAGLATFDESISENAVRALEEADVPSLVDNDYKSHRSRPVDDALMGKADVVVGISSAHAIRLVGLYPQYASKITSMPCDIPDPYGGDIEVYRGCLDEIKKGVEKIYEAL